MLPIFRNRHHPRVHVPRPRIRQPSRYRGVGILLAAALLMGGFVYFAVAAYEFGTAEAGFDRRQARELRSALKQKLSEVEAQRDELLQDVATFARTAQIDQEAVRQVRESLMDLQDERLELREEVAFLTSLLSDGKTEAGLRARSFMIEPLENPGEFRYRFTLSKYPQDGDTVKANLEMAVSGHLGNEATVVDLEKIVIGDAPTKLEFTQVTQVEGAFALPEDFEPENVRVKVEPKTEAVLGLEEEFSWIVEP